MTLNEHLAPVAMPAEDGVGLREPSERIDPRARRVWLIDDLLTTLISAVIIGGVLFTFERWLDFGMIWVVGVTGAITVFNLAWTAVHPRIEFQQWRYEIREDEVDLLHGVITRTRQIVPMGRIQHVDTTRGLIQRRYGLATVQFSTASGQMQIPQLTVERAAEVRDMIAARAKVHDDL